MRIQSFKLRFSDLIFIVVLVIALVSGQRMLGIDSDLGRHLTLGNYMLDEHFVPTFDLLSYTKAGLSRPPYEWLSQIILALANRLLGLDGVILVTSLCIALAFNLTYQFASRRSRAPFLTLILVLIATGASSIHWLPRPHIFTILLLVIWIEYLDQLSKGKPVRLYVFPLIMLFWVNLHGGFIFGILAWIAFFAGWLWDSWQGKVYKQIGRNLLATGATSIITTIITPDLWHNWDAVLNNRSMFILNRTVETMRPNLTESSILPYTLLLFMTILLFALNWKTVKAQHVFLLAGLGLMSLAMTRNIPLFAIACTPILSEMGIKSLSRFKPWVQVEERFAGFESVGQSVWPVTVAMLAIIFFAYANIKNARSIYHFDAAVFPVDAVDFLEGNPQSGHMFNEFNWGGYILYRTWSPNQLVFLDSQSDFYGEELMREYNQIINANDDWQELLEKYSVDWVIISTQSRLSNALIYHPGWKLRYQDKTAVIFHRLPPFSE